MNLSKAQYQSVKVGMTALLAIALFAGCKGIPRQSERAARKQFSDASKDYRPDGKRPALPSLSTNSPFADFISYGVLNHPQVEANYYDWAASVERITVERSLPDPRLTFEAYIADTVMSLMPGLMADIPGPGKLSARANVASAESEGKYFTFRSSLLQAAFDVKKAFYQLHFLDEKILVNRQTLGLLNDLEQIARAQNEVGKATLQDVLRTQIEAEKLRVDIANLEDSRASLVAQYKAALGMSGKESDPPLPLQFVSDTVDLTDEKLLETALARNQQLKAVETEVRRAEASLKLAKKDRVPDFTVGSEVDVKAAPLMWNPQFSMTLPTWRDKIAAEIAEAQANKRAAEARLSAQQIALAVSFAEKNYLYREATRNADLLQKRLIPRAQQSLDLARAAYASGQSGFLDVIDAERVLLDLRIGHVEAQVQREISLSELSLIIEGAVPGSSEMPKSGAAASMKSNKPKSGGM